MDISELRKIATKVRMNILQTLSRTKSAHIGSCFSVVDMLVVLYFNVMNINPKNYKNKHRDVFVLSKGHAAVALYSVLAEAGFCKKNILDEYAENGTKLAGHVIKGSLPGVEVSAGSLGHGLSMAVGMALNAKLENIGIKVFCLLGDGECNEGSVWEAVMLAVQKKLDNLYIIVDFNNQQGMGSSQEIISQTNLSQRFDVFGCNAYDVNGHDFQQLLNVFNKKNDTCMPVAIVAKTIKGKGVSFMENKVDWHYKSPTNEEKETALKELVF